MVDPVLFPPDYLRMTPHREVEGEVPLEEEGVGGEPLEEHGVVARNNAPSLLGIIPTVITRLKV